MRHEHMGQMIASLRKEKNYTQQELADTLDITDKAVSKWERGIAYPDILLIPKLAEILGVTTDILLSVAETSASSNNMSKTLTDMTLDELWQLFPIQLVEHNPAWADWYKELP